MQDVSYVTMHTKCFHYNGALSTDSQRRHRWPIGQVSKPDIVLRPVTTHTLIISDPPHDEVDHSRAAPALGLSPAEVRMKANYPVPEIWLASTERSTIEEAAKRLQETGLKVVVVQGETLGELPCQAMVKSFSYTDTALVAKLDDAEVELPYDMPVTAVFCTPRQRVGVGGGRSTGSSLTEGLRHRTSSVFMTRDSLVGFGGLGGRTSAVGGGEGEGAQETLGFLDVYASPKGELVRMCVDQDVVDFSGLGDLKLPNPSSNLEMFAAEFEDRFSHATVDRRLLHMQPRQRPMVARPGAWEAERKGFSYATEGLSKLLEAISSGLKDVNQFELSSRLAYLTRQ